MQNQINQLNQQLQQQISNYNGLVNEKNNLQATNNGLQQRLNDFESVKANEISNINNNFQTQIGTLNLEKKTLENDKLDLQTQVQNVNNQLKNEKSNYEWKISVLEAKIINLNDKIEGLNKQLTSNILKDLSKSYWEYSKKDGDLVRLRSKWELIVNITFGGIALLTWWILFMFYFSEIDLYKKIATFSLDILAISWLWFGINQYSYYKKLVVDYKNREVVAESFIWVLNNLWNEDTRNEATRVVMETLFSRSIVDSWNELPLKEVVSVVDKFINSKKS